jgi:ribosomal protein S18 acetylase RimI-like enzyme
MATLRPAVPADASAITDFINRVGREGRFVLRERATWTLEEEERTLASADGRESVFYVALVDGRIAGLLSIARGRWSKDAHAAELAMACRADCRRVGLGTALLERAVEWARSVGVEKVVLEVFSTNEAAISLYRRLGFEEEGRRRRQYRIDGDLADGVLMARWL